MTEVITERIPTEQPEAAAELGAPAAVPEAAVRQPLGRLASTERYQPIRGANAGGTRETAREGTRALSRFGGAGLLSSISEHIKQRR